MFVRDSESKVAGASYQFQPLLYYPLIRLSQCSPLQWSCWRPSEAQVNCHHKGLQRSYSKGIGSFQIIRVHLLSLCTNLRHLVGHPWMLDGVGIHALSMDGLWTVNK